MKKYFLISLLALTLTSCKKESQPITTSNMEVETVVNNNLSEKEKKTPAYLEQRVTDIYATVFKMYSNDSDMLENQSLPFPDSLFCSNDWNKWTGKVMEFDEDKEMGFFDADYWIMGQDADENISISDVKTVSMNDNVAVVELNIHNFDNVTRVRLDMVFEKGEWRVDDFIDTDYNLDWKKEMKSYLKGK